VRAKARCCHQAARAAPPGEVKCGADGYTAQRVLPRRPLIEPIGGTSRVAAIGILAVGGGVSLLLALELEYRRCRSCAFTSTLLTHDSRWLVGIALSFFGWTTVRINGHHSETPFRRSICLTARRAGIGCIISHFARRYCPMTARTPLNNPLPLFEGATWGVDRLAPSRCLCDHRKNGSVAIKRLASKSIG